MQLIIFNRRQSKSKEQWTTLKKYVVLHKQGTSSQYQYCYLDLVTICQLNQFNTNSEAAMLSIPYLLKK